ncbi:hypothetical protein COCC4DRAFT_133733 [Bipolaris maydis ATCC 48331]|uniref:Uncharacterized protein n=2 Tax=Cochliobolus heterostrophus TaxID=5016 RepID=M2U0F9_COCH5|nr:uncharacterized protein COCC4DRAFT_133733 [Bipolaris maydis ATCC 48331]EMD87556.1 hypothetical protein COCHEDRAFT_1023607 [Bipolaris maydis C5]KAJ5023170.1 hypothetical protein J3E73DRAFT_337636 [Bipolaris maydis]ENI06757.1 hypothetical protein COCC4DRAFT_133733 [Bipolaris maydis ATCC 48331]KAJ5056080.1 hypothetical protein J3E74DRAFT_377710 [Bipolaris maydis]KAJ6193829.1 hypothetical protein J3E72DRAFT_352626 [Bipolaris maydis]
MPTRCCIVPVEPADGRGDAVVVEVLHEGSHPLDVRLVGCEGESPYVASIRYRNLAELQHKFKGTDDEWAAILSHFLLMKQPASQHAHLLHGVRMVYTLKSGTLAISFRQDVQTIKVTLGEIVLPQDDEFEFNPFDWARTSAMAHAQTLQHMAELEARVGSEQNTVAKLTAQLDDFIKTKNEAESVMLQQFMELLNDKKRKIRDQSRLLAGAKVAQTTATAVEATRGNTRACKAGASRASKRKASSQSAQPVSGLEPESDSDQMEMDQAKDEERDEEEVEDAVTPEQSDDETDEETGSAPRQRARSSETVGDGSEVAHGGGTAEGTETTGVPPPRVLPFSKRTVATRGKGATAKSSRAAAYAEDDETDDEEL